MNRAPPPRYVIVQQRPDRRVWLALALALGWGLSLLGAWQWSAWQAAPALRGTSSELAQARRQLRAQTAEVRELRQRHATLVRSDQISRAANLQVQQSLAERDQEIAALRADTAFYQRLGGATERPRGLNVHSARFVPEAGGSWRYLIVLTQNLNRGAISLGQLRFQVEGVRAGKLATIDWDQLHQRAGVPAQGYSFRYFQQLHGSVMLPPGFTPQRVKVSLRGGDASVDQVLGWTRAPADAAALATRET